MSNSLGIRLEIKQQLMVPRLIDHYYRVGKASPAAVQISPHQYVTSPKDGRSGEKRRSHRTFRSKSERREKESQRWSRSIAWDAQLLDSLLLQLPAW